MMPAKDVVAIMRTLLDGGVQAWLDGGWAVDAALGEERRPHSDLDLVVRMADMERVLALLAPDGFAVTIDELPTRLELGDGSRHIDLHPVTFDEGGGGIQLLQDGTPWRYPPEGFTGTGVIDGVTLPCLSPEVQVLCHSGYEPDEDDRADVGALCERFGLELPETYG